MAAEKRAALVVSRWLRDAVGKDRTLINDPQEEEELRGRAERFFSHLLVDFPSVTRLMLTPSDTAKPHPLKCLICPRRRFASFRELRRHAHCATRRERRAEHLGYYDALVRARLPRYHAQSSSSSDEEEDD